MVYKKANMKHISEDTQEMPQLQKKGKRKVQGVPQSQAIALPRHQEEEEIDKSKTSNNQINVRKALRLAISSPSEVIAVLKGREDTITK